MGIPHSLRRDSVSKFGAVDETTTAYTPGENVDPFMTCSRNIFSVSVLCTWNQISTFFAIRLKIKLAMRVVTQARPSRNAVCRGCVSKWHTPFPPRVWSETTRTPETSAFSCGGTAVDSLSTSAAGAMPFALRNVDRQRRFRQGSKRSRPKRRRNPLGCSVVPRGTPTRARCRLQQQWCYIV